MINKRWQKIKRLRVRMIKQLQCKHYFIYHVISIVASTLVGGGSTAEAIWKPMRIHGLLHTL